MGFWLIMHQPLPVEILRKRKLFPIAILFSLDVVPQSTKGKKKHLGNKVETCKLDKSLQLVFWEGGILFNYS